MGTNSVILTVAVVAVAACAAVFIAVESDVLDTGADDHTVVYNENGGVDLEDTTFTSEDEMFGLTTPHREGYTFMGWYEDADFSGDRIVAVKNGTDRDIEVWANWAPNSSNGSKTYTEVKVMAGFPYAEPKYFTISVNPDGTATAPSVYDVTNNWNRGEGYVPYGFWVGSEDAFVKFEETISATNIQLGKGEISVNWMHFDFS